MAFPTITSIMVPLLSEVEELPDDLDLNYEDGCYYFRVPVAESECGRWLTTVDVGYREQRGEPPCPGLHPMDYVSFGYEISAFDLESEEVFQTMDPYEARCAIPNDMRQLVVDITCRCYQMLIGIAGSDYIYRFTKAENPCDAALAKHNKSTEILVDAGFSVIREGSDQSGRKFWLLGKNGLDHSILIANTGFEIGVGK